MLRRPQHSHTGVNPRICIRPGQRAQLSATPTCRHTAPAWCQSVLPLGCTWRRGAAAPRHCCSTSTFLVLALQSVLRHRKVLRITTVQISAVHGIFKGAEYWEAAAPAKFARFRNLTQQLARANVWVSAPTGNAYGADDVTRIGWPASNAGVIAVGCATSSGAPDGNFSAEVGGASGVDTILV